MCLGFPARIINIKNDIALVDFNGIKKNIVIIFLDNVKSGDYVMVHAGFAIEKISYEQAKESDKIWREIENIKKEQDE
jgi:hydrogenase expression/formation protein HypC